MERLLGTGLGSLAGKAVGHVARFGWLGVGIASLSGAAIGLLSVSYRVRRDISSDDFCAVDSLSFLFGADEDEPPFATPTGVSDA